jgi:hypothetical protein
VHQADTEAVVAFGKDPNHILHALLTLFTLGAWLIVWIILMITMGKVRQVVRSTTTDTSTGPGPRACLSSRASCTDATSDIPAW